MWENITQAGALSFQMHRCHVRDHERLSEVLCTFGICHAQTALDPQEGASMAFIVIVIITHMHNPCDL